MLGPSGSGGWGLRPFGEPLAGITQEGLWEFGLGDLVAAGLQGPEI